MPCSTCPHHSQHHIHVQDQNGDPLIQATADLVPTVEVGEWRPFAVFPAGDVVPDHHGAVLPVLLPAAADSGLRRGRSRRRRSRREHLGGNPTDSGRFFGPSFVSLFEITY